MLLHLCFFHCLCSVWFKTNFYLIKPRVHLFNKMHYLITKFLLDKLARTVFI